MIKKKLLIVIMVIVMVPLAGELKFYPFEGSFRVSFGTPLFFFFLLWRANLRQVTLTLAVATSVVLFRTGLDVYGSSVPLEEAFSTHFPVFFYYLTYGLLFRFLKVSKYYHKPVLVGLLGVSLEIMASTAEILLRSGVMDQPVNFGTIGLLLEVAFIRSFFVLGFFNILLYKQAKTEELQQKKQKEHMMMVLSGLYTEAVHLSKTMRDAETVTKESYELYRNMKEESGREESSSLLVIANKVHEIKKDNQRIYAGLSNVISRESDTSWLSMEEIGSILKKSNAAYAELLQKNIRFTLSNKTGENRYPTYVLLSVLNNLISNAVEAIDAEGNVELIVERKGRHLEVTVSDDGPGIPERMEEIVFEEGYTSKFDSAGAPSTGIGLSYVREVVKKMDGRIRLLPSVQGASFLIRIPEEKLMEMGSDNELLHRG